MLIIKNSKRDKIIQPGMHIFLKKRKSQLLSYTGSGHHQRNINERKEKKRGHQKKRKTSRNLVLQQKSHQKDKHLDSLSCKILWIFLNMDKGGTQVNG